MNILLWTLQILLAVHTAVGAIWKFYTTAEQTMPSLGAIPHWAWLAMSVFELLCAVALIRPLFKGSLRNMVPLAAAGIAAEMLVFCALHIYSGDENKGPMIYWLAVTLVCAFVAYGRSRR